MSRLPLAQQTAFPRMTAAAAASTAQEHVHDENCGHDHAHDHHHPAPVTTVMRGAPKVGRNDPCPCGSGKKHKKCCLV